MSANFGYIGGSGKIKELIFSHALKGGRCRVFILPHTLVLARVESQILVVR